MLASDIKLKGEFWLGTMSFCGKIKEVNGNFCLQSQRWIKSTFQGW